MRTLLVACLAAALAAGPVAADSQPYSLAKDSEFEFGCFGPCACPVLSRTGVYGGFQLYFLGPGDPGYRVYDVLDVSWLVPDGGNGTPVTGQGTYRISLAGDQERLTLSLQVGSREARVFDSGLVAKSVPFPAIDLDISASGMGCFDTVFAVHANPTDVVASLTPWDRSFGIGAVWPNPVQESATIEFALSRAARATLSVYDVRSRRRATLIGDRWLDPLSYRYRWSGTGDEGRRLPPGVYWLELVADGRRDLRRVVLLAPGARAPVLLPFSPP